MKTFLLLVILALLAYIFWDRDTTNAKNGTKDVLNQRSGETIRDAAEDAGDAVKRVGKDIKDSVKEAVK